MKIAMSGATGFIGSYLAGRFVSRGWKVLPLTRRDLGKESDEIAPMLEGADAVINLAGAPIIAKWTEKYKAEMYSSRVGATRKIVSALAAISDRPGVFISTSATGVYDTEGSHTEESRSYSDGFLGRLAMDWEREALKAGDAGMRTVIFRLGVVLGRGGGALGAMLTPFRLGLGGKIGSGKQPFSWVHIEDVARAYISAIEDGSFSGIYNLTAPNPVTNEEFTRVLGRALHRPAILRVPFFALRQRFGEGAVVLSEGQRVLPARLSERGFVFSFQRVEDAVKDCLSEL